MIYNNRLYGNHRNKYQKYNPNTKGAEGMNKTIEKAKATPPQEKRHFTRRIGSTTFRVAVYFNPEAKESAGDKISRLIRLEADAGKAGEPC